MTTPARPRAALRHLAACATALALTGCFTIEQGFRYDYDGRVYRADGVTPVKDADVRVLQPDRHKLDKNPRTQTDNKGRYAGTLQTHKGWQYTEGLGAGATAKAPHPPTLDHVVVQVQEKNGKWTGYKLPLPPDAQSESRAGVRKLRIPDLLIPTTQPAPSTRPTP
jgi:hypothetical protein